MTGKRVPAWLYVSFAITALLATFSLSKRYQVESKNRAVAIVAEADTIQTLASSQRISFDAALKSLQANGLSGIVLPEESVGDLVFDGRAAVGPEFVRLTNYDQELRGRIARGLTNRFGMFIANGDSTIPIGGLSPAIARTASIGIDPLLAQAARNLKMVVIARLGNPVGATDAYVRKSIDWASELGATCFLPQGEQVLGRRDSLPALIDELKLKGMTYASPEFSKIGGDANVVSDAPEIIVRLHSAQSAELDKLGPAEAIERYGKAAAERNQRVLLMRPLTSASEKPVDAFGDFVGKVLLQIQREGYVSAPPHPFEDSNVPVWLFVAIAISVLPACYWIAITLGASRLVWAALGFIVLLALASVVPQGRSLFALVAALAYPLAAFMLLEESPIGVLGGYFRTTLVSLIGGLCVAGLLNGLPFFVRADTFEGVKVAHFLPLALIGFYFFSRTTNVREALRSPIFWQQAFLGIVILAAFGFMASRTGNDNPAGVSGVELKFRALLDQFLYVRPRTKEFLVGHPALIIALGMMASKKRYGGWVAVAMMVAAIGQTSVVNTMCHLHTPLALSFARIGVGWVLGGIIGLMVWGVSSRLAARLTN